MQDGENPSLSGDSHPAPREGGSLTARRKEFKSTPELEKGRCSVDRGGLLSGTESERTDRDPECSENSVYTSFLASINYGHAEGKACQPSRPSLYRFPTVLFIGRK